MEKTEVIDKLLMADENGVAHNVLDMYEIYANPQPSGLYILECQREIDLDFRDIDHLKDFIAAFEA